MIILVRDDPMENVHRWYTVGVQLTLFSPHAVICGWGRRGSDYARWRILPAESRDQAGEMARTIVAAKLKRGYRVADAQGRSSLSNPQSKLSGA